MNARRKCRGGQSGLPPQGAWGERGVSLLLLLHASVPPPAAPVAVVEPQLARCGWQLQRQRAVLVKR